MQDLYYSTEKLSKKDLVDFFITAQKQFPFLFNNLDRDAFAEKLANHANFIVCRHSGRMAGILAFYMNNGIFAYITFVCTLQEFQGLSIFSGMLQKLELLAAEKGYAKIRLEVARSNAAAQQVYIHKDFSIVESGGNSLFMEKKVGNHGDSI